jgi:hypothetical protein
MGSREGPGTMGEDHMGPENSWQGKGILLSISYTQLLFNLFIYWCESILEFIFGPNKVLLVLGRRTGTHREDCDRQLNGELYNAL